MRRIVVDMLFVAGTLAGSVLGVALGMSEIRDVVHTAVGALGGYVACLIARKVVPR